MAIFKTLGDDIGAAFERDPAVRSRLEVVLCYPGFHALVFYRLARACWVRKLYLLGRFLSNLGRFLTGIEIHPGAVIGRGFFIDHGLGVVIGETSVIGDNVTLYHDVTLGGIAPSLNSGAQVDQKRHPTLADGVIVGSGAQVLGPITLGKGCRVGANSVVLKDVAPGVTVVGIPAKAVVPNTRRKPARFDAYGTPTGERADPMADVIDGLNQQIETLGARLDEMEQRLAGARLAARAAGAEAPELVEEEAPAEQASCNEN
jgi:serine O-acetyltransferase